MEMFLLIIVAITFLIRAFEQAVQTLRNQK